MRTILQVLALGLVALPLTGGLAGCNRKGEFSPVDMWNRSRLKTYEKVDFFPDRQTYRPLVPGTVARGQLFKTDDALYRGIGADGRFVNAIPASVTRDYAKGDEKMLLARGQERYQIYCSMCHGASGHGDGMVVQRGFVPPPDYRIKRLRDAPLGHFFDVMTNGYGAMYSYETRIPLQDRWAIAAYVRRLQQVQSEVVPDVRYDNSNAPGAGVKNAAPRVTDTTVGTVENPSSSSQIRGGVGNPPGSQPKNPLQAMPAPGAQATPGLNDGSRP
jgi:mono/diheme cytochrome c family protein